MKLMLYKHIHFLLTTLAVLGVAGLSLGCGASKSLASAPGSTPVDYAPPSDQPTREMAKSASVSPAAADAVAGGAGAIQPSAVPKAAPAASQSHLAAKKAAGNDPKAPMIEAPSARPLLIYEAQLGMRVQREKIPAAIENLVDRAEELGGYLVSRTDTSVQIRVPSQHFRAALKSLGDVGEVTRRSVTAQDVSEEYHDLEVRLKNLEAVRRRLEQFLAKAQNVSEALRVGQELERVGREIDQIKGRMQFLRSRAAFSLVSVQLEPKPAPTIVKPEQKPAPRTVKLPVDWLSNVGVNRLLNLH